MAIAPFGDRTVRHMSGRTSHVEVHSRGRRRVRGENEKVRIPIEVSARHVHISGRDLERLFGKGYKLSPVSFLSQEGQYACRETVAIIGKEKRRIENVCIVGPIRARTQVEVSFSDAYFLRKNPPLAVSGFFQKAEPVFLEARGKRILVRRGLIVPQRHIHCSPDDASAYGLRHGQTVAVRVRGERDVVFPAVVVGGVWAFRGAVPIDTDEANAAGIAKAAWGELVRD